mmetsp:Transcript_4680/g.13754  ORF Transcript_4680/g.13754 Transcript_4680/m.13754 type:complete len:106 (-) Transcript_4680:2477-2794(-)
MLLEHYPGRVLCSQPRRLAAVALAERVAAERGGVVGDETGYQIGQIKMVSADTRLTFVTCGLLLETLKTNGEHAFHGRRRADHRRGPRAVGRERRGPRGHQAPAP